MKRFNYCLLLIAVSAIGLVIAMETEIRPAMGEKEDRTPTMEASETPREERNEHITDAEKQERLNKVVKLMELFKAILSMEVSKRVREKAEFEAPFF